jgi:c-di-GMP-binding flagellar brake protein YcgR
LKFFIEEDAPQRAWAEAMKVLLLEIKEEVERVRLTWRKRIEKERLREYECRYDEVIRVWKPTRCRLRQIQRRRAVKKGRAKHGARGDLL